MIKIRFKLIIILCIGLFASVAHGVYLDPTAKTNVNKQTDLFEKGIEDYSSFESQMDSMKQKAIDGIGPGNIELILDKSSGEIEEAVGNLSAIKANDLHSRGREEVMKTDIMEELHVDYTKPLNTQHRKDAAKIADASSELLGNLAALLKDLGIDCKTVKGNKIIEPEYYIDVKKEQTEDTIYNRKLCEELRNKYNCTDELKVKCTRTGPRYGEWQYKTIRFGGAELHNSKMDWGFAIKRCRKEWEWFITPNHPKRGPFGSGDNKQVDSIWRDNPAAIIADARVFIAGKVGAGLDQIREDIVFPPEGRGIGNQFWGVGRWRHPWEEYEFGYWYRDVYQVCELWDEEWTEECKLQ